MNAIGQSPLGMPLFSSPQPNRDSFGGGGPSPIGRANPGTAGAERPEPKHIVELARTFLCAAHLQHHLLGFDLARQIEHRPYE